MFGQLPKSQNSSFLAKVLTEYRLISPEITESNIKQQAVLDSLKKSQFLKASFVGGPFSTFRPGI